MTIEISSLNVTYGATKVLFDVSLVIESGEWVAPIGPNGAGKSSLLLAIAGLLSYDGEIRIDGEVTDPTRRRDLAKKIAFVPQRPELPPTMTVADYVLLGRTPHISYFGIEKRHDREIVQEVLERLSLQDFSTRCLGAISGGEAQRAVLGRALAQESRILLLDEPTSSLDLGRQQQVLELVDDLRHERGLTVISAMHDLTLTGQFAERLCLLEGGHVAAIGTPVSVLTVERIATHFGANVEVRQEPSGQFTVIPKRTKQPTRGKTPQNASPKL